MKLPIMFFPGNFLTTATHLLVFPRKVEKNIRFNGIALAEGQAMAVWSDDLHKELEQNIRK